MSKLGGQDFALAGHWVKSVTELRVVDGTFDKPGHKHRHAFCIVVIVLRCWWLSLQPRDGEPIPYTLKR